MKRPLATWTIAIALCLLMGGLMMGPARDDSATVDETTFLSAGYTYWKGYRFYFVSEHPPLAQLLPAAALPVGLKMSDQARELVERRVGYNWTVPWSGAPKAMSEVFPEGRNNWYIIPNPEGQIFGQIFVYASGNNADVLLMRGRFVQIILTLIVGIVIFAWARRATGREWPALVALALWVGNPNALAHGHLITTDISATFGMALALFSLGRFIDKPNVFCAVVTGVATGVALLMKHTSIILGPIFLVTLWCFRRQLSPLRRQWWKVGLAFFSAIWAVLLIVYFPRWSAAPPLADTSAQALGVPGWFQIFRPILRPADYFKGLAIALGHSKEGHDAYLLGQWSQHGWWYFYPLVFILKSPIAFVISTVIGIGVSFLRRNRLNDFGRLAWIATAVYAASILTSNVNIGVRHMLPMFPWVCVGIVAVWPDAAGWRRIAIGLATWQLLVSALTYPFYIQYMSEVVGGPINGHRYLYDSNYDWGQNAKRLKEYLAAHTIRHIYLDYFGTQLSVDYLDIPNTRVNAEQASRLTNGVLVVSASQLVRPEWGWLREHHQPVDRIAQTLFIYTLVPTQ
jgi:hypothetical protein